MISTFIEESDEPRLTTDVIHVLARVRRTLLCFGVARGTAATSSGRNLWMEILPTAMNM
jgi:hypothetical protein